MVRYLENESDLDDLVEKGIVLVDFYAEWCGPCQMLSSILEEIDYMEVLKVNTDKYPILARKFGVMSIPTLCYFKNGVLQKKDIGYRTGEEIKETYKSISQN